MVIHRRRTIRSVLFDGIQHPGFCHPPNRKHLSNPNIHGMKNQATKKTGAPCPGPSKCPNHIGQQQRSEYNTDLMLFGSFVDSLTDFELKFLVHHYNAGLPFGRSITMADIKMFPIAEIIPFIKAINVGIIGQSVVDCINAKLATKSII